MIEDAVPPPDPKARELVYNARQRRWGQVIWDPKRVRFETGEPDYVMVFDTQTLCTASWPLCDLSKVVTIKGDRALVSFDDPGLPARLDADWRRHETPKPKPAGGRFRIRKKEERT